VSFLVVLLHTYLGDNMSDWFNWTNFFYLAGIMIAGGATFIGLKYKKLVDEIKEVSKVSHEAYEDGKLDNDERKKIMKEVLDVLGALMKIAWK
jgi:flagellar motor component MotA